MIFALLSFLFFIALEAFFALSEMALISAERLSLQKRAKNERIARVALKLLNNPERLFTTTIMGITMSIAGNAIFTSYFLISSSGNAGAIFSLLIPFFTFLFGQAFPKVIGKTYSQTLVLIVAPILYLMSFLFYPVYHLNQRLTNLIFRKKRRP
jgi:CBS domain containing-hemolysin-like protein